MRISALASTFVLAACGAKTSGPATPATPAATNTSIATARALVAGTPLDFELPCDGTSIYFGPFAFSTEGETLVIDSVYRSPVGIQICGGGAFVDGQEAHIQVAGLGCPEETGSAAMTTTYAFTPGAGGPNATPLFLRLAVADPRPAGCVQSGGTLTRR